MAAEVMAAELGLPLYQVDLSSLVSKWVGETEKNLRAVFRAAEGVKGILLFDEGDALFGNRTDVKNSQDRYGNMEVNYLLQEVERFNGVAVLSTNHFNNMDPAFLRRFTYTIVFGPPVMAQRERIWERNTPAKMPLAADVKVKHLAEFVLTGGSIKNCIRQAAARAAARNAAAVAHEDFLWAIKRELQKHDIDLSREMVGEEYWKRVAPEWEFRQTVKSKNV
jgi:SpoVK/Ycf46/Vps4 family AAA+-type ATPase